MMGIYVHEGTSVLRRLWVWLKEHREIVALIAIIALSVWVRSLFVYELMDRDEGSYGFIAQEILRGGIPYRDAIEMKPPGVFYLYALAIKLFGATVSGVRIFTTIYSQLTLLCVYACARLLYGWKAGLLAALFFALFGSVPLMEANGSNTEVFFCLPLVAAVLCMLKAGQSGRKEFVWASAFCAALAALIKTVAAPYIIVLAIFSLFVNPSFRARVQNIIGFTLVFWLMIGSAVGYFYLQGALHDFLLWNLTIPFNYAKGLSVSGPALKVVLPRLAPEYLTIVIASLPALYHGVIKRRDFGFALMLSIVPAVVAGISMPMKFFPHYFVQMLPFFCILAGVGVTLVLRMRPLWLVLWMSAISVSFGWFAYKDFSLYFKDPPEVVSMKKYGITFVDAVKVAEYIKAHTDPSDYILQWGFEPEIYFLADRRSSVPYPNSTAISVLDDVDAGVQNLVNRVMATSPRYIVINEEWANFRGYAELQRIIQMLYHRETVIGLGYYRYYLYRINGA